MQTSKIPEPSRPIDLDAVRGIAIALVVVCHYIRDCILDGVPNIIVGPFGLAGVALFFMLSGFLIERHLARDPNLFRYINRRIFRIMPGYLACLAVILVIEPFRPDGTDWSSWDIAVNALLLQDVLGAPLMLAVV